MLVVLVAGCEREAPTCDVLARHAAEHIHARPFMSDTDRVKLRVRVPFRVELTEEDRQHVERECAEWSADYKLCVIDSRGSGFRCGPEDLVWSTLPHVKRWLDDLAGLAQQAAWLAAQRAEAATLVVERLAADARLHRMFESGPRDPDSQPLNESLEQAHGLERQAHQLAAACEVAPLEQEACVALLPR